MEDRPDPAARPAGPLGPPGRAEMMFFFCHSFGLGCWLVRLPDVQSALGLGKAELSVALTGFPAGSLLALLVVNRLVSAFGLRRAWLAGHLLLYAVLPALGLAPGLAALALAMAALGMLLLTVQTAMNIQVDSTERAFGVFVMSRSHGMFMAGMLAGSLAGVASDALGMSTFAALLSCSALMAPLGAVAVAASPDHGRVPRRRARGPGLPPKGFLGVAAFLTGNTIAEGVMASWSTIHVIETLGAASPYAGLGFTAFAVMFTLGRFGGDHLRGRMGPRAVARVYASVALLAAAVIALAGSVAVLVAGYGLLGFGVALGFPYSMTAAARLGSDPAASAAWTSFTAMLGFQFAPVLFGFFAELTSLRLAFALLLPLLLMSMLATSSLSAGDSGGGSAKD